MPDVGLLLPGLAEGDPDDLAVVRAMVWAEAAWASQRGAGSGPIEFAARLRADDEATDALASRIAGAAANSGTPVIELVTALREALPDDADYLHAGLTSQDVIDTALVLVIRDVAQTIDGLLDAAAASLADMASEYRDTPALAHTLGQAALLTTFGARAATWLHGIAEARSRLASCAAELPIAYGGASGTLDDAEMSDVAAWAHALGLEVPAGPWHVTRYPVLRIAGALAEVVAALGAFAADVLEGSRPERGELREGGGEARGGSSSMAFKRNPVGAIVMRRGAIAAPSLLATLHTAAGLAVDERPDGAWQAEWSAVRDLARHALVSAASGANVALTLEVDGEALARNAAAYGHGEGTGHAAEIVDHVVRAYGRPHE